MGLFGTGREGKQVFYKTKDELEMIRHSCHLVCKTLAHVGSMLKPGITGKAIDDAAEAFILDHHARPAFKNYGKDPENLFPATLCVSYNDIVVHGIPRDREFQEGDIVSVDCGVEMDGFYGDAAFTFALGGTRTEVIELLSVTYASLYKGIEQATVGNRVQDISAAIQDYCERKHPYSVVRELVGHGLGRSLHEDPEVPNYGKRGKGMVMREGLVIAIEPMINLGKKEVVQQDDRWTIHTRDRKPSAHYEHTVAVQKGKADILSDHSYILEAVKNNSELLVISPKN
jgi:methionyl aminopeptidase